MDIFMSFYMSGLNFLKIKCYTSYRIINVSVVRVKYKSNELNCILF